MNDVFHLLGRIIKRCALLNSSNLFHIYQSNCYFGDILSCSLFSFRQLYLSDLQPPLQPHNLDLHTDDILAHSLSEIFTCGTSSLKYISFITSRSINDRNANSHNVSYFTNLVYHVRHIKQAF